MEKELSDNEFGFQFQEVQILEEKDNEYTGRKIVSNRGETEKMEDFLKLQ